MTLMKFDHFLLTLLSSELTVGAPTVGGTCGDRNQVVEEHSTLT